MAGSSSYMHFHHYQPQQHQQQRQNPYSLNNPTAAQSSLYTAGYAYYNPAPATTYRNVTSVASGSGPQQQGTSSSTQQSQTSPGQPAPAAPSFRAPAHKNSHHLHSIPPREKSTRTLIVDHMLWVHGRTRLAQARAELGMTDRTGGPSSTNYIHRTRPENYEEEDEVESDGEDGDVLLGWTDDAGTVKVKDEWEKKEKERLERQDLPLARTLRLRAEGLEKVVTSMLGQPPPLQPATPHPLPPSFHPSSSSSTAPSVPSSATNSAVANHPGLGPASGQHQPGADSHLHGHSHSHSTSSRTRTGRHPHILPNGVRLRLALGTLINDFFARQAPHPPYRHIQSRRASRASSPISRHASQPEPAAAGGDAGEETEEDGEGENRRAKKAAEMDLPKALLPLTLISGGIKSSSHASSSTSSSSDEEEDEEDEQDDPMRGNQSPYNLEYSPDYISYGSQNSSSFYQPTHQPVGLSPFAVPDFHQQQQYQSFSLSGQPESRFGLSSPARITRSLPKTKRNRTKPKPSARTVELYATGVDAAKANASHSSFRCPRHLYIGCQVCVEAKSGSSVGSSSGSGSKSGGSGNSGRTSGMGSITIGVSTTQGVGMAGNSATYASASSIASSGSALAGLSMGTSGAGTAGGTGGNITGWKDGTGIGTGLLKPDMRGSVLRRSVALPGSPPQGSQPSSSDGKSPARHTRSPSAQIRVQSSSPHSKKSSAKDAEQSYEQETGTGNTKLSKLIPRFIKLSALVAGELGREIRGEEVDASAVLQVDGATATLTSGAGPHGTPTQASKAAAADAGDADESGSESEGESGSEGSRKSRAGDSATPTPVKREEGTPRPSGSSSPLKSTTATPPSANTSSPAQPIVHPLTNKPHAQQHGHHHHHPNHIRHGKRAHEKMYASALQPTREWYLLLAGLLTRAVLEGYLTAGWSGIGCVECLMGVGVGVKKPKAKRKGDLDSDNNAQPSTSTHGHGTDDKEECVSDSEDEDNFADEDDALFEEVEPDEYPTLKEALRVLFPSLRCSAHGKEKDAEQGVKAEKGDAEKEYEEEMYRRLRMFYEIPESTPDLAAHMEDLAWRFPAEPIERAAVRFCEAIAKWRGKPELEGYKKKKPGVSGFPSPNPSGSSSSLSGAFGSAMISIESLVHSNPTSPAQSTTKGRKEGRKAGIGAYFISAAEEKRKKAEEEQRRKAEREVWSLKRGREDDPVPVTGDGSLSGVKRVRI